MSVVWQHSHLCIELGEEGKEVRLMCCQIKWLTQDDPHVESSEFLSRSFSSELPASRWETHNGRGKLPRALSFQAATNPMIIPSINLGEWAGSHLPSFESQFPYPWHGSSFLLYRVMEKLANWDQVKHQEQGLACCECSVSMSYNDEDDAKYHDEMTLMLWNQWFEITAISLLDNTVHMHACGQTAFF